MFFYRIARALITPIVYGMFRLRYVGVENLPQQGGYIICCNHRSFWDPVLIALGVRRHRLNFMAKKELFRNKLFGALITSLGAFPGSRGRGDVGAVRYAENILSEKKVLLIFPEGTRSKNGQPRRGKPGAARIAADTGAPVIPAAICCDRHRLGFRSRVTVCFGPPITDHPVVLEENSRNEDIRRFGDLIMEKIVLLMNRHLEKPVTLPEDREDSR